MRIFLLFLALALLIPLLLAADNATYPLPSYTGLPDNTTINAQTGVITGKPTRPGIYTVTVTLTDTGGLSDSETFTITVLPQWDVNQDRTINVLDMILVSQKFGQSGEPSWIQEDVNWDGTINVLDLIMVAQHLQ